MKLFFLVYTFENEGKMKTRTQIYWMKNTGAIKQKVNKLINKLN